MDSKLSSKIHVEKHLDSEIQWFPTLYKHRDSKKSLMWRGGFKNPNMYFEHGTLDGKIQLSETEVKTNKTSRDIYEQAELELKNRYTQKYVTLLYRPIVTRCGINSEFVELERTSDGGSGKKDSCLIPDASDSNAESEHKKYKDDLMATRITDDIPREVMMANKWDPVKTKLVFPVAVQPKLDGIRLTCLFSNEDQQNKKLKYFSRNNKSFDYMHEFFGDEILILMKEIESSTDLNVELDGELYTPDKTFEEITSIVRKTINIDPRISELNYYIFTFRPIDSSKPKSLDFSKRNLMLEKAFKKHKFTKLKLVKTQIAHNSDEILRYHDEFVKNGFEGIMIYNTTADYKQGRSSNLLKYKVFSDEEGEVVGVTCGKGKEKDCAILEIKIKIENPDSGSRSSEPAEYKVVNMRPSGSFERRQQWLKNPELIIGKIVTYTYQEKTKYGIPRFPVVKEIRDYE